MIGFALGKVSGRTATPPASGIPRGRRPHAAGDREASSAWLGRIGQFQPVGKDGPAWPHTALSALPRWAAASIWPRAKDRKRP